MKYWEIDNKSCEDGLKTNHQSGIALRQLVFDPLVRNCARGSSLIFVPDGLLWKIPFGALPLDQETGYLVDQFTIRYLNSGRELIKDQEVGEKKTSEPLIVSDMEYNKQTCMDLKDFSLKLRPVQKSKLFSFLTCLKKTSLLGAGESDNVSEILPGARVESEIVARLLNVPVYSSIKVRKALFQKCASPRIIHFASHGLFFPYKDNSRTQIEPYEKSLSRYVSIDNPMLRSALLLKDKPRNSPNPISAEQILSLDLRATELVVLSACDSGLGEIKEGGGVFGLRRAFMLVGARAVIMSLWQVADLPTTLLMSQFYRNFILNRQCLDGSLRDAQKYLKKMTVSELFENCHTAEIIETICERDQNIQKVFEYYNQQPNSFRPFEAPFYWGGFICVGQSASLRDEK